MTMPTSVAVAALPPDILRELKIRLLESRFTNYGKHAEWLQSLGYSMSKSSLHRYATTLRDEVLLLGADPERIAIMDLRMRCLELAALTSPDADDITERADDFLDWIGLV
ncbi:MAG: DUF3486 family protein [Rhodocyclaceae bacterium]|nr:DUF3486 family protein [Rhodocyclaceae bacterium]